jgi:hypothetical protein
MNGAIQHGKDPRTVYVSRSPCRNTVGLSRLPCRGTPPAIASPRSATVLLPCLSASVPARPIPPEPTLASRSLLSGTNPPGKRLLIATASRIEIRVTRSFKRRKDFLIETRIANRAASRTRLRLAKTAKINRDIALIESPASHCKQRAAASINRSISQGSFARQVALTQDDPLALRERTAIMAAARGSKLRGRGAS